MKKSTGWLWGCIFITLGVVFGLNALGLTRISIFFRGWWTLFIIIPSLFGLVRNEQKTGSIVGLIIGLCLLLACWGIFPMNLLWKLFFPAVLVFIGVAMVVRSISNNAVNEKIRHAQASHKYENVEEGVLVDDDENGNKKKSNQNRNQNKNQQEKVEYQEYWSTFSDQNINYDGKRFTGCRLDAVFGGTFLDLRKADIMDEAVIHASGVFGKLVIYVPSDVKVEFASTTIFGDVSDKRPEVKNSKTSKTIYIDVTSVFGGLEIR